MRRACGALAGFGLALALSACGGNELAPDLFQVMRSGQGPGAQLDLVVADDGYVRCNRGPRLRIPDSMLLEARTLLRELDDDALKHTTLAPGSGGQFTYFVRMQDGQLSWGDTSSGVPATFQRMAELTHRISVSVCGLPA